MPDTKQVPLPNGAVSAQEVADALWIAQIKLLRFNEWQTNFPGSRPELAPDIERLMASISALCRELEAPND